MASIFPQSTPSTPKRKHSELSDGGHNPLPTLNTTKFSFDLNAPIEDGSNSPRTKVAHKFRGLAIDGDDTRSEVARGAALGLPGRSTNTSTSTRNTPDVDEVMRDGEDNEAFPRKRLKLPERPLDTAPKHKPSDGFKMAEEQPGGEFADGLRARLDPAIVRSSKTGSRSQRSSSSGPKPRRRRSGTPPLTSFIKPQASATTRGEAIAAVGSTGSDTIPRLGGGSDTSIDTDSAADDTQPQVVDPVRAALTWHEDEITIYDPDDEDDDGTGINGIGFRPTATIAYTRLVRRKQQIAEYKKREESEARALRSQRRRRESGSSGTAAAEDPAATAAAAQARRVHFMEAEPVTVITT